MIREAVSSDAPGLTRLEADRFASERLSRRSFAALMRSASADVIVAERAGVPIGYAVLLTRRHGRSARLYSIAVAADAGGRGVGSALLRAAEAAALRRRAARMHLEVRADNGPAIRLYERAGYTPAGRRIGYYEDGTTALLYARALSTPRSRATPSRLRPAA